MSIFSSGFIGFVTSLFVVIVSNSFVHVIKVKEIQLSRLQENTSGGKLCYIHSSAEIYVDIYIYSAQGIVECDIGY